MSDSHVCYTSLRRNIIIGIVCVLLAAVVIGIFIGLLQIKPEFMEENAKKGTPADIAETYGYTPYEMEKVGKAFVCGNPKVDGKDVYFNFTNPIENDVLMRLEVYTVDFIFDGNMNITGTEPGKLLGQTGFIRPGEYVESVHLKKDISKEPTYVMLKVATYVEKTQESKGFFYITTIINQD